MPCAVRLPRTAPSEPAQVRVLLHPAMAPAAATGSTCSACHQHQFFQPCGLPGIDDDDDTGKPAVSRRRLAAGQPLFSQGDEFRCLYAVRSGTFASSLSLPGGDDKVCGFHMAGDVLALDGMASGRHASSAIAIDDGEVCAVAYGALLGQFARDARLQRHLGALMARELVRTQRQMLMLGHMSAQERLALFLLDLSQRFAAQGQSRRDFNLRMSRAQIGSYLGLTLETVSRTLTLFQQRGQLEVDNRRIRISDFDGFSRQFQAFAAA